MVHHVSAQLPPPQVLASPPFRTIQPGQLETDRIESIDYAVGIACVSCPCLSRSRHPSNRAKRNNHGSMSRRQFSFPWCTSQARLTLAGSAHVNADTPFLAFKEASVGPLPHL